MHIDLHIGTEKTGSTAIQEYLHVNRARLLEDHGVLVPSSTGLRNATRLAAACQNHEAMDDLRRKYALHTREALDAFRKELIQSLTDEIATAQPQRLIISSEHLSSRLRQDEDIEALHRILTPLAETVRIIVYLRRQDALWRSAYSTAVKSGSMRVFSYPEAGTERHDLHYDRLLDRWSGLFGDASLLVRVFERGQLEAGDVVTDFCQACDIPDDLERTDARDNRSLDAETIDFLRRMNAHLPKFVDDRVNPLRGDLGRAIETVDVSGDSLSGDEENVAFYHRFREGNRRVAERWLRRESSDASELFLEEPANAAPSNAKGSAPLDHAAQVSAGLWRFHRERLRQVLFERECLRAELYMERGEFEKARETLMELKSQYPGRNRPERMLARLARLESPPPGRWLRIRQRLRRLVSGVKQNQR